MLCYICTVLFLTKEVAVILWSGVFVWFGCFWYYGRCLEVSVGGVCRLHVRSRVLLASGSYWICEGKTQTLAVFAFHGSDAHEIRLLCFSSVTPVSQNLGSGFSCCDILAENTSCRVQTNSGSAGSTSPRTEITVSGRPHHFFRQFLQSRLRTQSMLFICCGHWAVLIPCYSQE